MNKSKTLAILLLIITCLTISCVTETDGDKNIDRIKFITETKSDTSLFKLNSGKYCQMIINIQAELPKNNLFLAKLPKQYNSLLLNINKKNSKYKELLTEYSTNLKADYGTESKIKNINSNDIIYNNITNIDISQVYNRNNILSIEKKVTVINNSDTCNSNNHYYNINIKTGKQINISDIIADENINLVQQLLVEELFKQLQITNAKELNAIGYFDIKNIIATNNFYYTTDGITWNYPSYEIACYGVGETNISLTYNQLDSILINN